MTVHSRGQVGETAERSLFPATVLGLGRGGPKVVDEEILAREERDLVVTNRLCRPKRSLPARSQAHHVVVSIKMANTPRPASNRALVGGQECACDSKQETAIVLDRAVVETGSIGILRTAIPGTQQEMCWE